MREHSTAAIGSLAVAGRAFLVAIDQCPDWAIELDRFGRSVAP